MSPLSLALALRFGDDLDLAKTAASLDAVLAYAAMHHKELQRQMASQPVPDPSDALIEYGMRRALDYLMTGR